MAAAARLASKALLSMTPAALQVQSKRVELVVMADVKLAGAHLGRSQDKESPAMAVTAEQQRGSAGLAAAAAMPACGTI